MPIPLGILAVAGAGAASTGAYDLLETTLITTTTTSVTFSNLNNYSNYKHLQVRATLNNTQSANSPTDVDFRFNNDTSSSYAWHYVGAESTSVIASGGSSNSYINLNKAVSRSSLNVWNGLIIDILDPFITTKNTTVRYLTGVYDSGGKAIFLGSGVYLKTDAITSMYFAPSGTGLRAGSRLSLYGIKG